MAIDLFRHDEEAYNSALKMLKTIGKATIIHPTDTGKSFIGFKLCEVFPQKSICRLFPLASWLNTQRSITIYTAIFLSVLNIYVRTGINWGNGLLTSGRYSTLMKSKENCPRIKLNA